MFVASDMTFWDLGLEPLLLGNGEIESSYFGSGVDYILLEIFISIAFPLIMFRIGISGVLFRLLDLGVRA